MAVCIIEQERMRATFKEYEYRSAGDGFVCVHGNAEGRPFRIVVQTLGLLLGRDSPDSEVVCGGCHTKCIHKSMSWNINILRPAGYPPFEELAWCEADVTRIGFCGPKKLSRTHMMLVPAAPIGWDLTALSMNGLAVDGVKLGDNQTRTLTKNASVSLCAGSVNLNIHV